ncbi:TetR family transcriptional regulator [Domibacillus antri]|uniref:TetR family transcriptional regulator n=1 Tax=Domibacillus antri TaxID=1714264 RepID=A0A1Q8Q8Q0_9BACI|nr:TetR/AcrR family transcriptional regulator [Domibacillus antri]OLN23672.1 TetR family transcriptional regulator [Domibacillus antri]
MEKTIDPRVIRTRKLIMDAFIDLSTKKEFKEITIKDITQAATVNRATFYYHFEDKYDLLKKVLSEDVMCKVISEVSMHEMLNEETVQSIFKSLIQFQSAIANQCRRSYEAFMPTIETILKQELQNIFTEWLIKQWSEHAVEELRVGAIMMSWALYGAAMHYLQTNDMSQEDYIQKMMPFISNGLKFRQEWMK